MRRETKRISLGELIAALYDEARRVTPDNRTREVLTYLALVDLQKRSFVARVGFPKNRRKTAA